MSGDGIRLLLKEDPAHPAGGHALLYLVGARQLPPDAVLTLRRLTPPEAYLGPEGWQPAEALQVAEQAEQDRDGTPLLRLGPAVVNRIAPYLKVEIGIPSLGLRQTVIWPALPQSPEEFMPTLGRVAGGAPNRRKAAPILPPSPPPPRQEEPLELQPEAELPSEPEREAEPIQPPPLEPIRLSPDDLETEPHEERKRRKRRVWPWVLLVLLLAIAGGLAAWQHFTGEPERLLCAWGVLDCKASVCPETMEARARADCLIGDMGPAEAFGLAEQLGGTGAATDRNMAWLLLDALAKRNYAPASLELGLCFDPLLPDGCSLRPRLSANARQALESYRNATAQGSADAGFHTDKLCEWLDRQTDLQSKATAQDFCR